MKEPRYLNMLEPAGLIDAFSLEPPEGFSPVEVGDRNDSVPAFITDFDLLTTADDIVRKVVQVFKRTVPFFYRINFRPRTLFLGTTVTEYVLFRRHIGPSLLRDRLISKMLEEKGYFVIVKDIPMESPLLSAEENDSSRLLTESLRKEGFVVMSGQALAYVPIDFGSTGEYLDRFSKSRRKDMKRKLRSFTEISVEALRTGASFFDEANIAFLYQLYSNTYHNSSIHFDKLTLPFFRKVFTDGSNDGVVFLYRSSEGIIAFNLCFVFRGCLVDKYIGFRYPEARKHNVYFLSWFHNLDYCIRNNLKTFIAGWTDPEIKAYLGARFTTSCHAVYAKNPLLRFCLKQASGLFESDKQKLEMIESRKSA